MTLEEFYKATEGMPKDAEMWMECDLWDFKTAESVYYNESDGTLIVSIYKPC